ncbi:MAG: biotin-dependent carboxyltransferase family protein, partial [Vibrio sp.]
MKALRVITPGALSLVQDLGRQGVGHLGFSRGGPVDLHAFCWANRLVGNPSQAAAIEITLGQVAFEALNDVTLSLTGAHMPASIDNQPIELWRSFLLKKGQVLRLGYARTGLRAYLAVQSGIDAPHVHHSCATVMRNHVGGLDGFPGMALQANQMIAAKCQQAQLKTPQFVPTRFIPNYIQALDIGIFETYQHESFTPSQKKQFYQTQYLVSDKLDRMGIRLQGEPIHPSAEGIISEGIAPGSIQFPPNG